MSNDNPLKVQLLSPSEADAFLSARSKGQFPSPPPTHLGRPLHPDHRKLVLADGFEVKGAFELVARDEKSGEVEWRTEQENLITDCGRHAFFDLGWTNMRLGFAPSTETPNIFRCSIGTDGNQAFLSANLGSGTVTPSTYTKQWSTTFGTPGSNRTLGIIWTSYYSANSLDGNAGPLYIWSYSLLTPPKTQTTTQTLEVIYKLSMNPIY